MLPYRSFLLFLLVSVLGPALPLRAQVKLNGPLVSGGSVLGYRLSPDGHWAVYIADEEVRDRYEVYSVRLGVAPSAPIKLNGAFSASYEDVLHVAISSDSRWVVYAHLISPPGQQTTYRLHSVPIDGSGPATYLGVTAVAGTLSESAFFALGPDGSRVVVRGYDLESVPIAGDEPPATIGGTAFVDYVLEFAVTGDSSRVVFILYPGPGQSELFSVPIDGSQPAIRISHDLASHGTVSIFALSPDGARAVYGTRPNAAELTALFSTPVDGSQPAVRLTPFHVGGRRIDFADVRVGSQHVTYRSDQITDEVFELFSVPIDGSGPPVQLNPALMTGGDVQSGFQVDPDGTRVLFTADHPVDEQFQLYSVPIAGGSAQLLSGALAAGGDVQPGPGISPDGQRVVYRADQTVAGQIELFSAPIDGSAAAVQLSGPMIPEGDVQGFSPFLQLFAFSPVTARVAYLADQDVDERFELNLASLDAPLDGSQPARKVSGALIAAGDVWDFALSGHGERIVYRADAEVDERFELYLVEIEKTAKELDGSPAPAGPVVVH